MDLEKIFIENISKIEDLIDLLENRLTILISKKNLKLIIIDSIAALFRSESNANGIVITLFFLLTFIHVNYIPLIINEGIFKSIKTIL